MRSVIFLTLLVGLALAILDSVEPELVADTLSGTSSVANAVVAWFDD